MTERDAEPSFRDVTATRCLKHATIPPTILPPATQECGLCMRDEGILVGRRNAHERSAEVPKNMAQFSPATLSVTDERDAAGPKGLEALARELASEVLRQWRGSTMDMATDFLPILDRFLAERDAKQFNIGCPPPYIPPTEAQLHQHVANVEREAEEQKQRAEKAEAALAEATGMYKREAARVEKLTGQLTEAQIETQEARRLLGTLVEQIDRWEAAVVKIVPSFTRAGKWDSLEAARAFLAATPAVTRSRSKKDGGPR